MGIACAILALFPIKIPHHGQSQVSLKNNGESIHEISFCPPFGMMTSRFFTIVVDMSCMADVPPKLPFWLHWYLTAFRFQVKGNPLLLQEQNLRLQPFIFSERPGQSRPTVALYDTFWKFIFSLNRAEKRFNSKFNSKQNPKYSFKKIFIQ